ncbi:MAG TPA: formylglycine-generating enzyme family protein [Chitinophagaceae bacterium]|jgi:formylglycine-generating enzyme required for sulfatase activity|nr:formylglycine-generating enzyme family protein [Chitinophagaceae bacterium]
MKILLLLFLASLSCTTTKYSKHQAKRQTLLFEPETILIQSATFQMGSNDGDSDERPIHTTIFDSFFLGKYEVTNTQFCQFLNEKGNQSKDGTEWIKLDGAWNSEKCRIVENGKLFSVASGFDNYPVIFISWDAAVAYCFWLSDKTGKAYRLPTEAEWEFAAGNGTKHTKYSWGNSEPSANKGGNVADESLKTILPKWDIFSGYNDGFVLNAPVGSFAANDFGLYDMTGNVWEWCSDWYGEYNVSNDVNPVGVLNGTKKVIRGGGWLGSPDASRVADRYSDTPDHRGHSMGFRVAMTLQKKNSINK